MSENATNSRRKSNGLGRIAEAAAGLGAIAAVLILLLSPIAAAVLAHPATFHGASWVPSASQSSNGCGKVKGGNPHYTPSTGVGKWAGAAMASTCKKIIG